MMSSSLLRWLVAPVLGLLTSAVIAAPRPGGPEYLPASAARATAARIRTAATSPTAAMTGTYPLPLAASWSVGEHAEAFDPWFQLRQIELGHHLCPWLHLPHPDSHFDAGQYDAVVERLAGLRLPIAFISLEWEELLEGSYGNTPNGGLSTHRSAGGPRPKLSPLTPAAAWYAAGRRWGQHPLLQRLQAIYPDPPRILFVSNNEQPRYSWMDLAASGHLPPGAVAGDEVSMRQAVGDAWIDRYRALQRGFRDGLGSDSWRRAALFVGYDAIGPRALGRWWGWKEYSLTTQSRAEPWPLAWDGASASYYVDDWNPITDYTVMSPQVEAMNWVPMLKEAFRLNPGFWFELSVWDGQRPGSATDKAAFYADQGQSFGPERYGGMVQFGMWLLRPRVVREFRFSAKESTRFGRFFDALIRAVDRVWADPQLTRFWQQGRLLSEKRATHPYMIAVDEPIASEARWFMLSSDANPPRPWSLDTPLRVFSLALEVGAKPDREWLIYAHAPRDARLVTIVDLPDGPAMSVVASQGGCFFVGRESTGQVEQLQCT